MTKDAEITVVTGCTLKYNNVQYCWKLNCVLVCITFRMTNTPCNKIITVTQHYLVFGHISWRYHCSTTKSNAQLNTVALLVAVRTLIQLEAIPRSCIDGSTWKIENLMYSKVLPHHRHSFANTGIMLPKIFKLGRIGIGARVAVGLKLVISEFTSIWSCL